MNFIGIPFVRLFFAFALGILLQAFAPAFGQWLPLGFWLFIGMMILMADGLFKPIAFRKHHHWLGLGICIWLAGLGYWLATAQFQQKHPPEALFRKLASQQVDTYSVAVLDKGKTSTGKVRITAELLATYYITSTDSVRQSSQGNILLYLPSSMDRLQYGDTLLLTGQPSPISPPANPNAFDYRAYLASQQIYLQGFPKEKHILAHRPMHQKTLSSLTWQAREYIDGVLRGYLSKDEVYGIASALVLGTKAHLSYEWKQYYAQAGAMHVLAVSGLHVGLVVGILAWLLKRWRKTWWAFLLQLTFLWAYALLTGMSASVLRAATMFSILLLGYTWRKSHNMGNTLAVSAFLLLCFDVQLLFNIGFQLSYAAVLGIVYLQPPMERFCHQQWAIKSWLGDKMLGLTTVSIAAQLATLPISLYYFHQFPTYFILSNFIVIPLAGIILPLGMLLVAVSFWPAVASVVAALLSWSILLMNVGVSSLQQLPYDHISHIPFDGWMMALAYGLLFSLVAFLSFRQMRYMLGIFSCCLLLAGYRSFLCHQQSQHKGLWIYSEKSSPIAGFAGGEAQISPQLSKQEQSWTLDGHLLAMQLREVNEWTNTLAQAEPHSFFTWQGLRIVRVGNDSLRRLLPPANIYIIHSDEIQPVPKIENVKMVFAYNLPWKARKRWKAYANSLNIPWHDLREGAFSRQ